MMELARLKQARYNGVFITQILDKGRSNWINNADLSVFFAFITLEAMQIKKQHWQKL